MQEAYVVGQVTVKDTEAWAEYRTKVPGTLDVWGGKLVFRGVKMAEWAGECSHPDIVVIHFPSLAAANGWFSSAEYQALIPTRSRAADVTLVAYEA